MSGMFPIHLYSRGTKCGTPSDFGIINIQLYNIQLYSMQLPDQVLNNCGAWLPRGYAEQIKISLSTVLFSPKT